MKITTKKAGVVVVTVAALSAIAGVIAGILFAPKSGEDTRKELKTKANDIKNKFDKEVIPEVKKEYKKVKKAVKDEIGVIKKKGEEIVSKK